MSHLAEYDELNPFPWYDRMRSESPVQVNARGVVNVFGYADVQRALSDHEYFSSNFSGGHDENHPISASLISTDPPRHRDLRSLVSQAFTPRRIELLTPRIEQIAKELLDGVAGKGEMDIVADFAYPLPVIVIAEMMGIPSEHRDRFKRWSDAVVTGSHEIESAGVDGVIEGDPQREMAAYFMQLMAERRQHPGDDLISGLLAAQIDGQHLSDIELMGFCVLLLVAGNETTTNLITNAMLCFLEQPALFARLRKQPEDLPAAIEEVLRYRSPVQSMYRVCVKATRLGQVDIRAGQPVIAWIGSANRDEAQFAHADHFDVDRDGNRHIAFGYGVHFCLGAPLARLEAKLALTRLLSQYADFAEVPGSLREPIGSSVVYGLKSLPITCRTSA
ncbi:MAG: cytochrome P450 [Firmicutes bacterium]|nr:cytochrome P450 [Bacillota bacterium]